MSVLPCLPVLPFLAQLHHQAQPAIPHWQVLAAVLHLGNVRFHDTVESGTPHAAVTRGGEATALEDAAHCLQARVASIFHPTCSIQSSIQLAVSLFSPSPTIRPSPKSRISPRLSSASPASYHFLGGGIAN